MTGSYHNMDFNNQSQKDAKAWIKFITPKLLSTFKLNTEVIILGLGTGEHVELFQKEFPEFQITVVDPRRENFINFQSKFQQNIKYISTLEGVRILKKSMIHSTLPVPILEFRPAWYPEKIFFQWAHRTLMGFDEWNDWTETRALFILESLVL